MFHYWEWDFFPKGKFLSLLLLWSLHSQGQVQVTSSPARMVASAGWSSWSAAGGGSSDFGMMFSDFLFSLVAPVFAEWFGLEMGYYSFASSNKESTTRAQYT